MLLPYRLSPADATSMSLIVGGFASLPERQHVAHRCELMLRAVITVGIAARGDVRETDGDVCGRLVFRLDNIMGETSGCPPTDARCQPRPNIPPTVVGSKGPQ
jgi:hypothetical protein